MKFQPSHSDLDFVAGMKVDPYIIVNVVVKFGNIGDALVVALGAHAHMLVAARPTFDGGTFWSISLCFSL